MKASVTLGLFALALLASPALAGEEAKTGVKWVDTYEKALETAKAEKKRVFIEFTATW